MPPNFHPHGFCWTRCGVCCPARLHEYCDASGDRVQNLRLVVGLMAALLCASPGSGQMAPSGADSEVAQRIEQVTSCLPPPVLINGEPKTCTTLVQRMTELHVPGVSIAVIHNGRIDWARGFGVRQVGGDGITAETRFQAGSISKPLAAMGALHLVQEGKLALDGDINASLTTWKLPASAAAPGAVVTLRELLTHTAGITVHGFPGYAAGTPVPTLLQVLNGEARANTAPIRVDSVPGKEWRYSGGGYTVMQQAVLDTVKTPFPQFLQDKVLSPTGMDHSTYEQPLPGALVRDAAMPYQMDGSPVVAARTHIRRWQPRDYGPLRRICAGTFSRCRIPWLVMQITCCPRP